MSHRHQDRRVRLKIVVSNRSTCTLDHDRCVVCSDTGIPVRVVSLDGDDALCEDAAGNRMQVAVELVAPVRVGDVLLVHGGVAIGHVH